jgi:hypothetical protein
MPYVPVQVPHGRTGGMEHRNVRTTVITVVYAKQIRVVITVDRTHFVRHAPHDTSVSVAHRQSGILGESWLCVCVCMMCTFHNHTHPRTSNTNGWI